MATEEANLIQPPAMSDIVEKVEDSEVPAENKSEEQSAPQEMEEQMQPVCDNGAGLEEQPLSPDSNLPEGGKEDASSERLKVVEDKMKEDREGFVEQLPSASDPAPVESKEDTSSEPVKIDTSSEPVKVVDDEMKGEKSDQKDVEPLKEARDDKGEVSAAKDNELVKSDDAKGTVSSPEISTKRKKDKKKRKGSKGRDRSSDTSRSVPKLRKKSSRSEGSSGGQGQAGASSGTEQQQATDLLEDIIVGIFEAADVNQQGFLSRDDYIQLLRSERLGHFSSDDLSQYLAHFDQLPNGIMTYAEFKPVAYNLILMYYRTTDTSSSEWCPLQSPKVGLFFLNKYTGYTQIHPPPEFEHLTEEAGQGGREHDIAFLSQTYADLEVVNRELENERERHKVTINELAKANEELENVATQLYETGQTLDETNAELQARDVEFGQLQNVIAEKDEEIAKLNTSVMELQLVQQELDITKQSFMQSESAGKEKDQAVTEKDSAISHLRYQFESLTDQIKTARGVIDARDSTIEQLQRELDDEKKRTKELEDQVTQLQKDIAQLGEELHKGKSLLDEKISALSLARKQLRNTRERNSELERMLSKLNSATDKLRAAECEIKTLKSFLTSKTAIMERRKKELKEIKEHVMELEDKDQKRTHILADVLEKTARLQQNLTPTHQPTSAERPSSAPNDTKEANIENNAGKGHTIASHKQLYTMPLSQSFRSSVKSTNHSKASKKSRASRRLPPITPTKRAEFTMPTKNEIQRRERESDSATIDHSYTNPNCQCYLCRMDDSLVMGGEGVGIDEPELAMSQQVSIGDRVIIQIKKSMYELEPQKVTGIVRYVGRIDSEFVDTRMYVGVKLDEPYGNTDGVFKGKRYFKCPANHGKFVRITNIISVLPVKSMFYRPVVNPSQPKGMFNTPAAGTTSNRSSAHSVKVL